MTNWELIRKKLGLTLQEVGDSIGLSKQHLSKLERANKIPLEKSEELAKVFEYPCVRALKEDLEADMSIVELIYKLSILGIGGRSEILKWDKVTKEMEGKYEIALLNYLVPKETLPTEILQILQQRIEFISGLAKALYYCNINADYDLVVIKYLDHSYLFMCKNIYKNGIYDLKLISSSKKYPTFFEMLENLYSEDVKEKEVDLLKALSEMMFEEK